MFWKKLSVATVGLILGLVQVAAAQDSPVLKRIQDKGVISMGYREGAVPFSYIGPDGKPQGFSVDICMKIVDKVKETLKRPDLKLNLVPVTSANRIPLMANGTIDLECGTAAETLSRLRQDLAVLGIERVENNSEPEDHAATLCEIMAGLAGGRFPASEDAQREMFEKHVAPWMGRLFADMENASAANFYRSVGSLGRIFLEIEAEAFTLAN